MNRRGFIDSGEWVGSVGEDVSKREGRGFFVLVSRTVHKLQNSV